jgi:hypothetical protein
MTQEHPITPPPELIRKWSEEAANAPMADQRYIATQAARWGADQELETCCHLLRQQGFDVVDDLRATRRPKPLSLKQQALATLEEEPDDGKELLVFDTAQVNIIRRALEQLPND